MNYEKARHYLTVAAKYGIKLNLDRIRSLLALLGDPQEGLSFIHIAGTNGKGSTSAFCESILAAANLRVGRYTSPYITRFTERISVLEGRSDWLARQSDEARGEIRQEDFARILTRVAKAVEQMLEQQLEHPTEFELLTATAFLYFQEKHCDIVVLETGLGGRLDATNVISKPLAVIITALGYDHVDILGSSLARIAAEKAGIIKEGRPVFLFDPQDLEHSPEENKAAQRVIEERCAQLAAPLTVIGAKDFTLSSYDVAGQVFFERATKMRFQMTLLGLFQPINALLAVQACRFTHLASEQAIKEGIAATSWPVRAELINKDPFILIDGAHNRQSAKALGDVLDKLMPQRPLVFLTGVLADKDVTGIFEALITSRFFRSVAFVCVQPDNPRALTAEQLAELVRQIRPQLPEGGSSRYNTDVYACATVADGVDRANQLAKRHAAGICAFGSLYLVGEIRQLYLKRET